MEIAGTVALVTGGASGIGLAIARALQREGARLAIADLARDWLDEAVAELGGGTIGLALDVADRAAWGDARTEVEARLGPVDILVNNAGIGPESRPLAESDGAAFDRMIAIKLGGSFNGIRTFVPGMLARGRGHVVNTASMAGLQINARLGAYTAAKFGLVGMTEVLAAELAGTGVGASVLCPGFIATRLAETTRRAGIERPETPAAAAAPRPAAMDPALVGELVIEGIRANHLHIVTHGDRDGPVRARMQTVLDAFTRQQAREAAHAEEQSER